MKSIMVKTPHDTSFSFSRRFLHWRTKSDHHKDEEDEDDDEKILTLNSLSHVFQEDKEIELNQPIKKKKMSKMAVSKVRSALTVFNNSKSRSRIIGTLFGYRRGHVHFAFQEDSKLNPFFLIELAMPTSTLVKEMASGLVRIALETEMKVVRKGTKLLEEPLWRTYCNGKKCGYAIGRECGPEEWKVLKAVEPISMGAGVLPNGNGELMYMRAKFERVVGSRDSEAFYMMNPDGHGGPELSFYLLRV